MKKLMMMTAMVFCVVGLGACKATLHDGPTKINVENGGNGDFCPPGQAKKGNC